MKDSFRRINKKNLTYHEEVLISQDYCLYRDVFL